MDIKYRYIFKNYGNGDVTVVYLSLTQIEAGAYMRLIQKKHGTLVTRSMHTGLQDKDNTDIYDGDILSLDSWSALQIVRFIEGAFCLVNQGERKGVTSDIHYIHHAGINQSKIVGDIYRNPDLLPV